MFKYNYILPLQFLFKYSRLENKIQHCNIALVKNDIIRVEYWVSQVSDGFHFGSCIDRDLIFSVYEND